MAAQLFLWIKAIYVRSIECTYFTCALISESYFIPQTEINDRRGSAALTTRHPSIRKSCH
jgi:hypothetical protein